jgi:transcriptional regulator with XRE-family HTH domain
MLAEIIKKHRESIGWTQQEFADKAKVSFASVYKIEKGKKPSKKILTKILRVLCLNINDLLNEPELTPEDILYLENKKTEHLFYHWRKP